MPPPEEITVNTLPQFTDLVSGRVESAGHPLWYRGCGKAGQKLVPALYRHPKTKDTAGLGKLERSVITRFRARAFPFHQQVFAGEWELLFFMQHFRVPTRLLDWTENPYMALYFAVTSGESQYGADGSQIFSDDAAVWVLDAPAWNAHALHHISYEAGIPSAGEEEVNSLRPNSDLDLMGPKPVALYGTHNSARIVAQRGVFTIFGKSTDPMETIFEREAFPPGSLVKIMIPKGRVPVVQKSLFDLGITDSVVFPDLDGLSIELRRFFGFEI